MILQASVTGNIGAPLLGVVPNKVIADARKTVETFDLGIGVGGRATSCAQRGIAECGFWIADWKSQKVGFRPTSDPKSAFENRQLAIASLLSATRDRQSAIETRLQSGSKTECNRCLSTGTGPGGQSALDWLQNSVGAGHRTPHALCSPLSVWRPEAAQLFQAAGSAFASRSANQ